jgi:hypothetical protein
MAGLNSWRASVRFGIASRVRIPNSALGRGTRYSLPFASESYLRQMPGKTQCDFEVEILWEISRRRTRRSLNEAIVPKWSYIVGGQIVNDAERGEHVHVSRMKYRFSSIEEV